ncbi:hypothetical protein E4U13_005081 [Claviceps humidiphila]|uniref:EKC/KEOPS complex subunit BUD32 n=1 Tax=Claviceps humidiphila TaxID=1294629 RepID=A0A9P7PWQ0_9HYPO|nr:hypothetical protein E4U13_005081 [Claviceps humidiphila]
MHQNELDAMRQRVLELEEMREMLLQQTQKEHQLIQKQRQQIQEKDQQKRPSTLCEYVEACHSTLYSELPTLPSRRLKTNGSTTNTYLTSHPIELKEWIGFVNEQKLLFDEICDAFPPEHRAFDSPNFLESLREDIKLIGKGIGLERFISDYIEEPATRILRNLQSLSGLSKELRFGGDIAFIRSSLDTSMPHREFSDREIAESQPVVPTLRGHGLLGPDNLCVLTKPGFTSVSRTTLFVCEVEALRGIPVEQLRRALLPMSNLGQASQPEPTAADAEVKHTVMQSCHYLMESSIGLGVLVTGQAFLFLRVDWNNPGSMFYHIAAPAEDVAQAMAIDAARGVPQATSTRNSLFLSAVGQYLAFTLMAMRHPRLPGQEARLEIIKRWLGKGPRREDGSGSSESSGYCTNDSNAQGQRERDDQNTKSNLLSKGRKHRAQDWPYCSQKCLLGLVRGHDLDWSCPNVTLHCQGEAGNAGYHHKRHSINHSEWLSLLWDQFQQSLDVGMTYTGAFGARGMFFKVTLLAYGYTFVSKGAISAHAKYLQHEAEIYKQLEPTQGVHVPVFLGVVDLRTMKKNFWVGFGVQVVHLMFLSWGGHHIEQDKMVRFEIPRSRLIEQAEQAMKSVHDNDVIHRDVRWENVLFNPETKGVMMIDFERSDLLHKLSSAGQDASELETLEKTIQQLRLKELHDVALAVQVGFD